MRKTSPDNFHISQAKVLITLIIAAFIPSIFGGCDEVLDVPNPRYPSTAAAGSIEHIVNFGIVKPGSAQECSFTVINEGNHQAQFEKFVLSCGCLTAKIDTKELSPGESTTVRATIATPSHAGRISQTIACVFARGGEKWEVPLSVVGIARNDLMVTPRLLNWSVTPGADIEEATFTVFNFSETAWEAPSITGIDTVNFELSYDALRPPADAKQAWRYTIRPLVKSDTSGSHASSFEVSSPESEEVEDVEIVVIVKQSLTCLPNRIFASGRTPRDGALRLLVHTPREQPSPSDFRVDNSLPEQIKISIESCQKTGELRLLYSCLPTDQLCRGQRDIYVVEVNGKLSIPFTIVP